MSSALDRLMVKLARQWVEPYLRVNEDGNIENVSGYFIDVPEHAGFGEVYEADEHLMRTHRRTAQHLKEAHPEADHILKTAFKGMRITDEVKYHSAHRIAHGLEESRRQHEVRIPKVAGEATSYNKFKGAPFDNLEVAALKGSVVDIETEHMGVPSRRLEGVTIEGNSLDMGYAAFLYKDANGQMQKRLNGTVTKVTMREPGAAVEVVKNFDPTPPGGARIVGEVPPPKPAEKMEYRPDPKFQPSPGDYPRWSEWDVQHRNAKTPPEHIAQFEIGDTVEMVDAPGKTYTLGSVLSHGKTANLVEEGTNKQVHVASTRVTSPTSTRKGVVLDAGRDKEEDGGGPRYTAAVEASDGAYYIPTGSNKTQHTAWAAAFKISKDPNAKARRDQEKAAAAEAKKAKATKAEALAEKVKGVSSNMTVAYEIAKTRKFTDSDIDADMTRAAMDLLEAAAIAGQLWSPFLEDMYDAARQRGKLSPGQARGTLNALRKFLVQHLEGRAKFDEMIEKKAEMSAVDRLAVKLART